ncbi:MAG: helix-turn-helix domain-containing protein [Parcubacteria group bacterium]|jgi:sugar-specific transcriptional regulator TrmB
MDQDLVKILETAGFTKKEAEVYLALLALKQGNVTEISTSTKLKRSIIYVILEGLIKRGYASELPDVKINTYQAMDPTVILNKLRISYKNFSEMLPIFRSLGNTGKERPKITYHETKEGILNAWEEMNYPGSNALFISSYQRIEKHFPGAIADWIDRTRRGIIKAKCRHLISDSPFELKIAKEFLTIDQEVRTLPDLRDMQMDFTIYDNKLAITSLGEEPFIVLIESEELVQSMRPIFELVWGRGKKIT